MTRIYAAFKGLGSMWLNGTQPEPIGVWPKGQSPIDRATAIDTQMNLLNMNSRNGRVEYERLSGLLNQAIGLIR